MPTSLMAILVGYYYGLPGMAPASPAVFLEDFLEHTALQGIRHHAARGGATGWPFLRLVGNDRTVQSPFFPGAGLFS